MMKQFLNGRITLLLGNQNGCRVLPADWPI
jgi:hypothetical protein